MLSDIHKFKKQLFEIIDKNLQTLGFLFMVVYCELLYILLFQFNQFMQERIEEINNNVVL